MITRVLVANRGEIARRVFATCRRLGIGTVAVCSDADAALPFVAEADQVVRLPGDSPSETYLRHDLVLDAARRTGADAVHPGYGFGSESAEFARAVREAGLTWIGPDPESIEAMGSKVRAKELMREAGVPVLEAPEEPGAADLPLLVKASAGGGGRGMRVVRDLEALADEIAAAEAEAQSAFGDGTVFCEPYVEQGRHVELQIWGNYHGTAVTVLGARDCSLQRRHQKVVEEAPPPGLTEDQRTALAEAARAAGEAIGYRGAGTVEFLVDARDPDRFWFLEMNTRLQVEHPVTEAVLGGLDLVELQLTAAEDPTCERVAVPEETGHAIEVRLYAEDPAADYQPQSGRLTSFDFPEHAAFTSPPGSGLRVDAGFAAGTEVSTHYDAMLAKVVAYAPTRVQAARQLAGALERARVHGVRTNRDQLLAVLRDPTFLADEVSTGFLDGLALPAPDPRQQAYAAGAAALALAADDAAHRTIQRGIPLGWRNVPSQPHRTWLTEAGGEDVEVRWWGTRGTPQLAGVRRGDDAGEQAAAEDATAAGGEDVPVPEVLAVTPHEVRLRVDGVETRWRTHITADGPGTLRGVDVDGPGTATRLLERPRFVDPAEQLSRGSLLAPMPGTVLRVDAAEGPVSAGDPILVLEAMKMQHTVTAPEDGHLALRVSAGTQVAADEVLAVVTPASDEDAPAETGHQDDHATGHQAGPDARADQGAPA